MAIERENFLDEVFSVFIDLGEVHADYTDRRTNHTDYSLLVSKVMVFGDI